jgi:MOSC domain-containing protein YiiM
MLRHATHGPWGDGGLHLGSQALEHGLSVLSPPSDRGRLELIVVRRDDGAREIPQRVVLTEAGGVPGDAWHRDHPEAFDCQITVMRADVARLFANGQPLTLPGDNLLVDLDLSLANLPAGSQLRLGATLLEVTPKPHNGCSKFRQRFGADALRLTADPRFRGLRLRGIHVRVARGGEIAVGQPLEVVSRATASGA